MFWPPSSSGLGRRPLTAVAWVRIPSGVQSAPDRIRVLRLFRGPAAALRAGGSARRRRRGDRRPSGRRGAAPSGRSAPTPTRLRSPRRAPSRTGAETLATPGSRSAALCAHPRLRTSARVRSVNSRPAAPPAGSRVRIREQHFGAGSGRHRQPRADGHRIAKSGRRFQGRHTDARGAFATVELHALSGDFPQSGQHHRARGQQWIVDMACEFGEPGAKAPRPSPSRVNSRCASSPRRGGVRSPAAGRCVRRVRRARRGTGPRRGAPPPLCPARRCRYPVSQGDTSVPDCEIVKMATSENPVRSPRKCGATMSSSRTRRGCRP